MSRSESIQPFAQLAQGGSPWRREVLHLVSVAAAGGGAEPAGLVDGLAGAVAELDRAAEEGWRLVSVRLLRDAGGNNQLDARLARSASLGVSRSTATPAHVGKAA